MTVAALLHRSDQAEPDARTGIALEADLDGLFGRTEDGANDQVWVVSSHASQELMFDLGDHAALVEPEDLFRRLLPHETSQPEDQHRHNVLVDEIIVSTTGATANDPKVHLRPAALRRSPVWIEEHERNLREVLRPARTRAENEARTARLGRRHAARDVVTSACGAIADAEATLEALRAEGEPTRTRFEELDRRSRTLHGDVRRANTLDGDDRHELYQLDQVVSAVDTFVDWTRGQPVTPEALTQAFHDLEPLVRRATILSTREDEIDHRQWNELLGPGVTWLRERGIEPDSKRAPTVASQRPEVGLGR